MKNPKKQPVWRLLHGLGIRNVGKRTAKTLLSHPNVSSLIDIFSLSEEELVALPDVGPTVIESIMDFDTTENRNLLQQLEKFGLSFEVTDKQEKAGPLLGKTFVLTGVLEHFTRDEASKKIEALGGKVSSSVSKKTNYLIAGKNAGGKLKKAEKLEIDVLDEQQFLEFFRNI